MCSRRETLAPAAPSSSSRFCRPTVSMARQTRPSYTLRSWRRPPKLLRSRRCPGSNRLLVLAIAVALFVFLNGPVWRHVFDWDRTIGWSYAAVPPLVLLALALRHRLSWVAWLLHSLELVFWKFAITAGILMAVLIRAGPRAQPPAPPATATAQPPKAALPAPRLPGAASKVACSRAMLPRRRAPWSISRPVWRTSPGRRRATASASPTTDAVSNLPSPRPSPARRSRRFRRTTACTRS